MVKRYLSCFIIIIIIICYYDTCHFSYEFVALKRAVEGSLVLKRTVKVCCSFGKNCLKTYMGVCNLYRVCQEYVADKIVKCVLSRPSKAVTPHPLFQIAR